MKKMLFLFGLIIFVVLLSGCGGRTRIEASKDGVKILSFIVEPSEVEGGELVYLLMDIQNLGGAAANNIRAQLVGLPQEWNVGSPEGKPDMLYPPEGGMEGEMASIQWTLTAPESQTTIDYPVEGMITYGYSTNLESLVRIANRDWLMSLPLEQREQEREKQGTISGGTQKGPIQSNIKFASVSGSTLILDIQNVGSGFPTNNQIAVNVNGMTCDSLTNPVKLIRGKSSQYRCEPVGGPTFNEQWKNVRIDVDLAYDYVVKTASTITVMGRAVG
jgi:hypothetical protein